MFKKWRKRQIKKTTRKRVLLWYNYCDLCAYLLLFTKAISLIASAVVERHTLVGTEREWAVINMLESGCISEGHWEETMGHYSTTKGLLISLLGFN